MGICVSTLTLTRVPTLVRTRSLILGKRLPLKVHMYTRPYMPVLSLKKREPCHTGECLSVLVGNYLR